MLFEIALLLCTRVIARAGQPSGSNEPQYTPNTSPLRTPCIRKVVYAARHVSLFSYMLTFLKHEQVVGLMQGTTFRTRSFWSVTITSRVGALLLTS